jgi:putative transcriptional regulator
VESTPSSQLKRGSFLIASPDIESGLYFRGVVLLCEHSSGGSFGLVVNKGLDIDLPPELLDLDEAANPHLCLRAGGPIQTNQMMILHSSDQIPDQTLQICDGAYLGGDIQFLQESVADPNGPDLMLCFGYSGWNAGQLEREFLDGQWFVRPATAQHLFHTAEDELWQVLLREMGGKYATLSMIPDDLSLN